MKSSSEQYPVALMHTEMWMAFSEDVYLLKTNNSDDKTVELALTRLYDPAKLSDDSPVYVLIHDTFENRNRWMREHETLLCYLLERGADLWLLEMRGHGLSPKNRGYQENNLNDIAAFDLPAVQAFVNELNPGIQRWVGAGEGALAILRAVEAKTLDASIMDSIHALDMSRFHWIYRTWVPGLTTLKLMFDQRQYFNRPRKADPEFRGIWKQLTQERALLGSRKTLDRKRKLLTPQVALTVPTVIWLRDKRLDRYVKWGQLSNINLQSYDETLLCERLALVQQSPSR